MTLNTVSSEPHISLFDHLNSPVFFVSLALHLFVFPCVFSLVFFPGLFYSHCHFPLFFFHSFFLVFPTHPRTLSPQSALPHPLPSLFIQGLMSLVLCICLKIGPGRETLSSENNKSVRLILWKALQSGRALFRWEDYYIVKDHKMAVRVLQRAQEDVTMRRSLEKKWIAKLKEDDRFQVINRDEGADILSL